jgi:hypothetical protein
MDGQNISIRYHGGPALSVRLTAPARASSDRPVTEIVESNVSYLWQRIRLPDPQWPRVIELRADVLGGVVIVAHLQRLLPADGFAPDFGWQVETKRLSGDVGPKETLNSFELAFASGRYRLYHPAALLKQRGRAEVRRDSKGGFKYEYLRCTEQEEVPMQPAAWRRAELVIAPAGLAPLRPTLELPHQMEVNGHLWNDLYQIGEPLDLKGQAQMVSLLSYHHDATVRAMAEGDDFGNVTDYVDGRPTGVAFGMNRLNHCPAIFEEGYRSGDTRLIETGALWCDNFYDLSIWWGPKLTGGTRYNNMAANHRTPLTRDFMWRSNDSSNFCTKGLDAFFTAYEQSADRRMIEALEAQFRYASEQVHADRGECRNIGDVRDFVRLYEFTGRQDYLDQALRLFRELRTKLSPGDLFSQSGRPIVPDPPFIDEDDKGYKYPFAKPYIIGYALSGLPLLARLVPDEPKLKDVIRAVADFMAAAQDPIGGWRYPHPRSSSVMMNQAMEHAWQLVQADQLLGADEKHLDAIERVLRQRLLGWQKTGEIFSSLTGWEIATGLANQRVDLYKLYARFSDRDPRRDYTEGRPDFGTCPPEGLVYFPEVLRFYLQHRPVTRLLAPPKEDDPLGIVLARVNAKKNV